MKALTVRQPWASLLIMGIKRMETRSWDTKHRGPVMIHAGAAMPCKIGSFAQFGDFEVERDSREGLLLRGALTWPYRLPMGALLGTVDLFQTRPTTSLEHKPDDRERALGDHSPGRFAWSTCNPVRLPHPIPAPGRLGLWNLPADIEAQVLAAAR